MYNTHHHSMLSKIAAFLAFELSEERQTSMYQLLDELFDVLAKNESICASEAFFLPQIKRGMLQWIEHEALEGNLQMSEYDPKDSASIDLDVSKTSTLEALTITTNITISLLLSMKKAGMTTPELSLDSWLEVVKHRKVSAGFSYESACEVVKKLKYAYAVIISHTSN